VGERRITRREESKKISIQVDKGDRRDKKIITRASQMNTEQATMASRRKGEPKVGCMICCTPELSSDGIEEIAYLLFLKLFMSVSLFLH
jgi:hypothetical protein